MNEHEDNERPAFGGVVLEDVEAAGHFIAGSTSPIALEPRVMTKDHLPYFGAGEFQLIRFTSGKKWDCLGCVSYSSVHHMAAPGLNWMLATGILERDHPHVLAFLNGKNVLGVSYIKDGKVDLSERFTVVMSGTGNGNSAGNVLNSIRNHGVVPESVCPAKGTKDEADYRTISDDAKRLGQEFLTLVRPAWQAVPLYLIREYLVQAPVMIFTAVCPGWSIPGSPVKACGMPVQHATAIYKAQTPGWPIHDSYDPFLKVLEETYPIPFAFQLLLYPIPKEATAPHLFTRTINPGKAIPGERSQEVLFLQARLGIPTTGTYDEQTRGAVLDYQIKTLLRPYPGILGELMTLRGRSVGPKTLLALNGGIK